MKTLPFIALALTAAVATPAAADIVHQTSVPHANGAVSVSYEPRTRTSLRPSLLGRGGTACVWNTSLSIERRIADASGRPIAALTRTVGEARTSEGVQAGYCNHLSDRQIAPLGGSADKMRAFLAETARRDSASLHAELADLGSLGHTAAR